MMKRKEILTLKDYLENSFTNWWIKVMLNEKVDSVYKAIEKLKEKYGDTTLLRVKDIKPLYEELENIIKNDPNLKKRHIVKYYLDGYKHIWINDLHYPELRDEFMKRYNEELEKVGDEKDVYEIWIRLPNGKTYWINLEEFDGFIKVDALGEWNPEIEKFHIDEYVNAELAGFMDFWIYDIGITSETEKRLKEWSKKLIDLKKEIENKIKPLIEKEFGIKIDTNEKEKLEDGQQRKEEYSYNE